MADDSSNKKRIGEQNKKKRDYLKATKVEMKQEIVKTSTDKKGNIKEETETVTKVYPSGTAVFAEFFNTMAEEANRKAQKEADKPKYRMLDVWRGEEDCESDDMLTQNTLEAANTISAISDLQEKIYDTGYLVQIIENLDCKNVTEESRYFIRIEHNNGVYVDIDLLEYEKKIKDFSFNEQAFMEEQISKIIGSVTPAAVKLAEYTVNYLSYIIYFKRLYTLTYRKIGWEYYDWNVKGWIFKYDKIYSKVLFLHGRGINKYTEGLQKVSDDDLIKETEWVECTIAMINKHPFDALIIGAGISGLVRQLLPYTKEMNININILGKPATGKSVICHFLLGIFGNPELLEGSFVDTENATEQRRVSRPILPYVLDDRMLKLETDSEKMKQQKIIADVFREYEGKVKERLGKQYEEEAGERAYGPVISSSVKSMMDYLFISDDLGQFRRFMEFNIGGNDSGNIFSNEDEAKLYEKIAYKNYGIGIEIIIEYMLHLLDNAVEILEEKNTEKKYSSEKEAGEVLLKEKFDDIGEMVAEKLKLREEEENEKAHKNGTSSKIHKMGSSSNRFALIILSYQIFREALIFYMYNILKEVNINNLKISDTEKEKMKAFLPGQSGFKDYLDKQNYIKDSTEDILKILIDNLVDKLNKVNKPLVDKKLYEYIMENKASGAFVELNTDNIKAEHVKNLLESKGKVVGYYLKKNKNTMVLYTLECCSLMHFWEMFTIPSIDVIQEYCHTVLEEGMTAKVAAEFGIEKYHTEKDLITKEIKRSHRPVNKKNVEFQYISIKIPNEEGEE